MSSEAGDVGVVLASIITLPFLYVELATIALLVRRLHDTDRSAWWLLLVFLPYVGAFVLLIFTLQKGAPGLNRYRP
jgi:uncharacterized membrane protein YhaH (DUF805 family)